MVLPPSEVCLDCKPPRQSEINPERSPDGAASKAVHLPTLLYYFLCHVRRLPAAQHKPGSHQKPNKHEERTFLVLWALCVSLSRSISAGGSPRLPPAFLALPGLWPPFPPPPRPLSVVRERLVFLLAVFLLLAILLGFQRPWERSLVLLSTRSSLPTCVCSDWSSCCPLGPCFLQVCIATGPPAVHSVLASYRCV